VRNEFDTVYDRFVDRRNQRRYTSIVFIVCLVIAIVTGMYAVNTSVLFYNIWLGASSLALLVGTIYILTRPWAREKHEIVIFAAIYEALKILGLSGEDDSLYYCRKSAKKLGKALSRLESLVDSLESVGSTIVDKNMIKPLGNLYENVQTRIFPRIAENKDIPEMVSVLQGLAQIFGETIHPISINDVVSKNKDLERYTVLEVKKPPSRVHTWISKEPVRASASIVIGLIIAFSVAYFHSVLFKYDFGTKLGDLTTFFTVLAAGAAISAILYAAMKRST